MERRISKVNHLIKEIQNGNANALDVLYNEIGPLLLNMAKKYLFNKDYAEDLLSEVFLELTKKQAKSFNDNKNGLNWLFVIIKNKAYKYNSFCGNTINIDDAENSLSLKNYIINNDINIQDITSEKYLDKLILTKALDQLSLYENKLLYYKYWECLTIREIAKILDKPHSTIHYELKCILKKLQQHWKDTP